MNIQEQARIDAAWLDDLLVVRGSPTAAAVARRMREAADEIDRLTHALNELSAHHDAATSQIEYMARQIKVGDEALLWFATIGETNAPDWKIGVATTNAVDMHVAAITAARSRAEEQK